RMPANTSADEIKAISPDGIFLSNGPGNPAADKQIIENIKAMTELSLPIFGVSFGHQLLALSQGAETEKHSYGHRGANQPVIDLASGKTYVTEQNHGYIVKPESLDDSSYRLTHINANDKTCEGIKYNNINAFSVQFYPAAHGGPLDTSYLFDDFVKSMNSKEAK
ncbi:MAG: carbamoyl phosphate synthase small subunit, partial [Clostridia bacterium]|nr:carbamoyl phosphate synthase small subunit [Clostridia bacterium]